MNMPNAEGLSSDILEYQISKIANGDKKALADLYDCISASVYSYALSVLKNCHDAEDVLSDTVLDIWRSAPNYRSMGRPMGWVMTIARNLCMMSLRRRSRISEEPSDDYYDCIPDRERLTAEDKTVIRACIESLGDDEREIVILHTVAGLKHREISAMLKLPPSTVRSKYNRAIGKLKKMMRGE